MIGISDFATLEKVLRHRRRAGRVAVESSGPFGAGPLVLEAWGENAVCLSDRDAYSAQRLRELP